MSFRIIMGGAPVPLTLTYVGQANSVASTGITSFSSTGRQAGDLSILVCRQYHSSALGANSWKPSGWTTCVDNGTTNFRSGIAYKVLAGTENSLTPPTSALLRTDMIAGVWRPNKPITTVAAYNGYYDVTNANPAARNVGGTGASIGPVYQIGLLAALGGVVSPYTSTNATGDFTTSSAYARMLIRYDAGVPSLNLTVDMDDEGNSNNIATCYITVA